MDSIFATGKLRYTNATSVKIQIFRTKGGEMKLRERHPQLIAAAILATGALLLAASILEFSFLQTEPPGVYLLMPLSIVFLFGGSY